MENRWYTAQVLKVSKELGVGFHVGQAVYVRKVEGGRVTVFNGGWALRGMTTDEARACLKLGGVVAPDVDKSVSERYEFELWR